MSYVLRFIVVERDDNPIRDVKIGIRRGSEAYFLQTNLSGVAEFAVDEGNWTYSAYKSGYESKVGTVEVLDDIVVNIRLSSLIIPSPNPDIVTVYAYCYDSSGNIITWGTLYYKVERIGSKGLVFGDEKSVFADNTGLIRFTAFKGSRYLISPDRVKWISIEIPEDADSIWEIPGIVF